MDDGGPPPLRGEKPPDIFGFKHLDPDSKEAVRIGTCLAHRCLEMADWMVTAGRSMWFETPKQKAGQPSVFKLLLAFELLKKEGVDITSFVQCPFGALSTKPTDLMSHAFDTAFLPRNCEHPSQWWIVPWSGETHWGPHALSKADNA